MDLAQAFNAGERITFAGREFDARQLTIGEWAALQSWLKREFPSPYTTALASVEQARQLGYPLSPDVRDAALAHAAELTRKWPPRVGSPAWLSALDSVEGGAAHFLKTALRAAGNALSDADADELAEVATGDDWRELTRAVYYGEPAGPKAPTAGAATPTAPPPTTVPAATTGTGSSAS